ncbi:MAG: LPS export ABC transporter periplasmic protein LptC [Elusimicrobiota bacterium]|nr:LPS export ABC transporter periplasmic protein LptC [Elusimicrobiota bacterium]
MNFENDRNKLKIINPKIYFYDKKDKDILRQKEKNVIAWMTSKNAIINVYTKDMHAYNDVVMFSNTQNIKLTTEEVFYDNEKDLFYSHKFVSIVQGDNLTEGIGFDAKSDLSQINIKKDVIIKYLKKDTKIE